MSTPDAWRAAERQRRIRQERAVLVRADETERRIGAGYTPELLAAWGVESFLSIRTTDGCEERTTVFRVPVSLLGIGPLADGQGGVNSAA